MRKIVVLTFISLDGVMQAPGGPREDVSGGFKFGGWTWPYFDEASNAAMGKQMAIKADLLLGRTTFEIFAAYWPDHEEGWPGVNAAVKYVASSTLSSHRWNNSVFLGGNAAGAIRKLSVPPFSYRRMRPRPISKAEGWPGTSQPARCHWTCGFAARSRRT